jgi:hypothetical protein
MTLGRTEEAQRYLEDVVQSDPGSEMADEARALLQNH